MTLGTLLRAVLFAVISMAAGSVFALNPATQISQYGHSSWKLADGILIATPNAIAQTGDGYVWIGTDAGLLRFDGVRFTQWTPPGGGTLPSPVIVDLMADREGGLWIGTLRGIAHWTGRELESFAEDARVNNISEDRSGTVWFARSRILKPPFDPVCSVRQGSVKCYGADAGLTFPYATAVWADRRSGAVWVGSSASLARLQDGKATVAAIPALAVAEGLNGIGQISAGTDGSVLVGMSRSGPGLGLQRFMNGTFSPLPIQGFDSSTVSVNTHLVDDDGTLWIGSVGQGLYRIHGDRVDHFGSIEGLSSDAITGLLKDHEGTLWVTTSRGIDAFRDLAVLNFGTREGLGGERVQSVLADGNDLWVGSREHLDHLRAGDAPRFIDSIPIPGVIILGMLKDRTGRLWLGVDRSFMMYDGRAFHTVIRPDSGLSGVFVSAVEDGDGSILTNVSAGRQSRVLRVRGGDVEQLPDVPGSDSLFQDRDGGVWAVFKEGAIARLKDGRFEQVLEPGIGNGALMSPMIDADGNLLGGTTDGLVGVRNGQRHRLDSSNGLPCDLVRSVIIDDDGNLWLAMSCGIVSIARDQIERWWRDPASPIESRLFDPSDGASNDSPNGNPRVAKTADGKLWFATGGLLSMVDPHRLPINHIAPPVSIESLMVDSVRHDPHEALRLPAQPGNLEIDYTALSFVNPQRVRFRYRLEGRDKAWQDAGTRRQAFYNDLAPGQYRFQVIAANASGIWNETGDAISFEIPPAWYQSVAFRAACAVLVLMLAWGLYRLRIRQVAAVFSARFEERLLERTRIARDLHDTLLQTVQGSKMVADNALADPTPERLHQTMGRLSEWLSEAIEEARSALQALRTTSDDSHDLVDRIREAIRQPVDDASLTTSLVIEGEARPLRPIARDQIYRIVQEALLNARRHAGATRLEVTLSYVEGLLLTIRDNGQGVSPDIIRDGRPGHFGLRGMHERAQRIGASLELESSPENGTTVRLVVPMKNNFSTEI